MYKQEPPVSRMNSARLILAAAFTAFLAIGCTKKDGTTAGKTENAQVNLAIWGNYLSPASQQKFTELTGIKLNVLNYSSNEELLAKIQAGPGSIDVAVPSDYMVGVMIKLGLLEPLDRTQLTVIPTLLPEVMAQPYDAQNTYSLPYAWATAGIAVNRSLYKEPITSWGDLFNNPKLAGKFALLDDVREVTGAVLKFHGHSVNTTDEKELEEAKKELLAIRSRVKIFSSDTINILKTKEVAAAQVYSPDSLQLFRKTGGDIEYIIPKEGGTRSIDNVVIFASAKNKTGAHKLINFLLSKENNLEFVKTISGGPVIKGVREELPPELKNNKSLFPDEKTMSRLERIVDLGEKNRLYENLWMEVKAQ